jgi:hypothetical protein
MSNRILLSRARDGRGSEENEAELRHGKSGKCSLEVVEGFLNSANMGVIVILTADASMYYKIMVWWHILVNPDGMCSHDEDHFVWIRIDNISEALVLYSNFRTLLLLPIFQALILILWDVAEIVKKIGKKEHVMKRMSRNVVSVVILTAALIYSDEELYQHWYVFRIICIPRQEQY